MSSTYPVRMTNHARTRRAEFRLTDADVRQVVDEPSTTYPCAEQYGPGVVMAQRGEWSVAYRDGRDDKGGYRLVITILRSGVSEWDHSTSTAQVVELSIQVDEWRERVAVLEAENLQLRELLDEFERATKDLASLPPMRAVTTT